MGIRDVLTKQTADTVVLFPYKDIPKKEWPVYYNDQEEWVSYPEEWRNFGYELPYPTTPRLKRLGDLTRGLSVVKKKVAVETGDPAGLANYMVHRLIKGIKILDPYKETTTSEKYDLEFKEWLEGEFTKSAFLVETLRSEYEKIGGKYKEAEDEDEGDFSEPSETTSSELKRDID